jgi:hypothetical protein
MTVSTPDPHRRWAYLYAYLTGILGLLILGQLFVRQAVSADLPTLLLFTGVALIVSYFQVPIGGSGVELNMDGAILLGATLVGGPIVGGWAAFITGLSTPLKYLDGLLSRPATGLGSAPRPGWRDNTATAAINGGRNVIAIAVSWMAYRGLGGTLAPNEVDTRLALALIVTCIVYALVRCLWLWPAMALRSGQPWQTLASLIDPTTLLIEFFPLPVSLLTSATFTELGRPFFLLLALVFIGLGAVMRRLIETTYAMRGEIDVLTQSNRISRAIATVPQEAGALVALAYQLCTEVVTARRFEIGLYTTEQSAQINGQPDPSSPALKKWPARLTHVCIQIAVHSDEQLPPMRVPLTPLWLELAQRTQRATARPNGGAACTTALHLAADRRGASPPVGAVCAPAAHRTRRG